MASLVIKKYLDSLDRIDLSFRQLAYISKLLQDVDRSDDEIITIINSILTKKVKLKSINGIDQISIIQSIIHQPWLYKVHYLCLSLDDAIIESTHTAVNFYGDTVPAVYKWLYSNARTVTPNVVCTSYTISNIVGLHMAPITIPGSELSTLSNKQATILIDEFSSQSYTVANRRYHFVADIALISDINISTWTGVNFDTTNLNRGYYWFNTPFKSVSSFTLTFALSSPLSKYIAIPLDRGVINFLPGRETLIYISGDLTTGINHLYFKGFNTQYSVLDKTTIDLFNRLPGHDTYFFPETNVNKKMRVVTTLDTSLLTNLHDYLIYTDLIVTNNVTDGAALNSSYTIMYSNPVRIRTPANHGLASGATVFITGFVGQFNMFNRYGTWMMDTIHYTTTAFDNIINSVAGHVVTVIDSKTFSVPVDGTVVSYKEISYVLFNMIDDNPYVDTFTESSATVAKMTLNPVIQLEVITTKD